MRPSPTPQIQQLAAAYGVSAPAIIQLRDRHSISPAVLADPDQLFPLLIAVGNSGKIRNSLQDPATRRQIKATIASL